MWLSIEQNQTCSLNNNEIYRTYHQMEVRLQKHTVLQYNINTKYQTNSHEIVHVTSVYLQTMR